MSSRAAVEVTEQWEQAVAGAWRAIQTQHPELAELSLVKARAQTVPCADTDTATTSPAVQAAIEQASGIKDLDNATIAGLVGQVALIALLHLAAHALATVRGQAETSNRGYYHSQVFVRLATEVGLEVAAYGSQGSRGFHRTGFGDNTSLRYDEQIEALAAAADEARRTALTRASTQPTAPVSGSRNYVAANCACTPARRIRVSRAELERGGLLCRLCDMEFTASTST